MRESSIGPIASRGRVTGRGTRILSGHSEARNGDDRKNRKILCRRTLRIRPGPRNKWRWAKPECRRARVTGTISPLWQQYSEQCEVHRTCNQCYQDRGAQSFMTYRGRSRGGLEIRQRRRVTERQFLERLFDLLDAKVFLVSPPPPINVERQMQTSGREQKVVRKHPEPVADVYRCKESCDSGSKVEVRQSVVQEFRQPDLSSGQVPGLPRRNLGCSQVHLFRCRSAKHGGFPFREFAYRHVT